MMRSVLPLTLYAFDPDTDPMDILRYDERINAVGAEDIQRAALEYLPLDRYVRVVLFPESFQPAAGQ